MFTGLIETVGEIITIKANGTNRIFTILANFAPELNIGESVAVDGCCLTVIEKTDQTFQVEVTAETLKTTTLRYLRPKDYVNLERALLSLSRLGGHFVLGHIDEVGRIRTIRPEGQAKIFQIGVKSKNCAYLVTKGSIAVDGISLTINSVRANMFTVNLIPYTLRKTTLGKKGPGDLVNIEYDILAKLIQANLKSNQ
uniref:Riboflavin synthase n=1 Tax=candidate division WOR-3 bacterium TaxID=2052148 RepID=A0A7C6EB22_UNCW3